MLSPSRLLIWQLAVKICYHAVTASRCLGGSDIFATVRENSPFGQFVANFSVNGDHGANTIRLCLAGENASWLYLEGQTIRLNSSSGLLDREVLGSILMAELKCYEDDILQSRYRVMIEILNENDNEPRFLEETIQPFHISELAAVNSVVFGVKAIDADGDTITYIIDKSLPDASYFRIDLPNSGNIILDKPLDYETKTQLQLVIYAMETNTREKHNVTATVTVNIIDGDDQYPQFVPCTPASTNVNLPVCTNPIYTANITEQQQDVVLEFSPGPIHAEDGDRSLDTPLAYTILSGADSGRFMINSETGEITLTKRVENRDMTSTFRLRIMASQLNDPNKYAVTTALVNVVAENSFPPVFNQNIYKGFVIQSSNPATIVKTYRNQVLIVQTADNDFTDGVNPKVHYSIHPMQASEMGLYHITQEGVLIVRTDRLQASDRRHVLQVVAMDQDSGEVATASVEIEVLQESQPALIFRLSSALRDESLESRYPKTAEKVGTSVPWSPWTEEQQLFGDMDNRLVGGVATVILLLLVSALFPLLGAARRRRRDRQNPADRGGVVLGQHQNVVDSSRPVYFMEELTARNEALTGEYQPSRNEILHGKQGVYTRRQSLPPPPTIVVNSDQKSDAGQLLSVSTIPGPNGHTHGGTNISDSSMLEKEAEGKAMKTEHTPAVNELTPSEKRQTGVTLTHNDAEDHGDHSSGRTNTDEQNEGKPTQESEVHVKMQDADTSYKNMHDITCDEDSTKHELKL